MTQEANEIIRSEEFKKVIGPLLELVEWGKIVFTIQDGKMKAAEISATIKL